DDLVLVGAAGLGAAEMNGERGEGALILADNRRFFAELLTAQAGHLAAAAAAGRKRQHQDGTIADIAQTSAGAGGEQLGQHIAGDRLGALATAWPWHSPDRQANG